MDWKKTLGAVAPTIARLIGGPLGGVAVTAVTAALGIEPTEDALEKKVENLTAADLLALKNAEQQFAKDMKALDVDFARVAAEDRASARQREIATKDWVVKALALGVFGLFAYTAIALTRFSVPEANSAAANQVLGILYAAVVSVLGYYFGSSAGSARKDETIQQAVGKR